MWYKADFYVGQFRTRILRQKFVVDPAYTGFDLSTSPNEAMSTAEGREFDKYVAILTVKTDSKTTANIIL